MQLIALVVGVTVRIALPLALLLWGSSRLLAWDQSRVASKPSSVAPVS